VEYVLSVEFFVLILLGDRDHILSCSSLAVRWVSLTVHKGSYNKFICHIMSTAKSLYFVNCVLFNKSNEIHMLVCLLW